MLYYIICIFSSSAAVFGLNRVDLPSLRWFKAVVWQKKCSNCL